MTLVNKSPNHSGSGQSGSARSHDLGSPGFTGTRHQIGVPSPLKGENRDGQRINLAFEGELERIQLAWNVPEEKNTLGKPVLLKDEGVLTLQQGEIAWQADGESAQEKKLMLLFEGLSQEKQGKPQQDHSERQPVQQAPVHGQSEGRELSQPGTKLEFDGKQQQAGEHPSPGKGDSLPQTGSRSGEHFERIPLPGKEVRRGPQERDDSTRLALADKGLQFRLHQEERAPLADLRMYAPEPVRGSEGTLANGQDDPRLHMVEEGEVAWLAVLDNLPIIAQSQPTLTSLFQTPPPQGVQHQHPVASQVDQIVQKLVERAEFVSLETPKAASNMHLSLDRSVYGISGVGLQVTQGTVSIVLLGIQNPGSEALAAASQVLVREMQKHFPNRTVRVLAKDDEREITETVSTISDIEAPILALSEREFNGDRRK